MRLVEFGAALEQVRGELAAGRSLGHVVIATVTLPGGLVRHYQHQRDHTPDPDRRRDAERVLEDLRSLCRAAQAHDEQRRARDADRLPRARRRAARPGGRRGHRPADHRLDDPPGQGHGGAGGGAARLRGGAAALVAVDLLAGPRAAGRGAPAVLRRRHPRQGPAADHPRRRARPAPDRRPVAVPHRGRACTNCPARWPPEPITTAVRGAGPAAAPQDERAPRRTRAPNLNKEIHVQPPHPSPRTRRRAPTPRRRPCSAVRSRPARSAFAR